MNRGAALPGGIANLNDTIQVIDRDGTDLGLMICRSTETCARAKRGAIRHNPGRKTPSRPHRASPQSEDGVSKTYGS